jgi:hypothetical protein
MGITVFNGIFPSQKISTLANVPESPWLDHGAHKEADLIYQSLVNSTLAIFKE